MSSEEDLPILPALESMENHRQITHSHNASNSNNTTLLTMNSKNRNNNNNNNNNKFKPKIHADSHKNAVENVMEELAKEHIDKTVLKPSSNFNGRPCLNMKDFFKLMSDKNKRQQNLDALYNLVENDSDSVIGFVELNGLSFIDEWLDIARKQNDHWFSLCILQFLCHKNLSITYEALQTVSIAKAVKQYISCSNSNDNSSSSALSPQSIPRLTEKIKSLLPNDLNTSRANDNFVDKIDRSIIHKICHQVKDIDAIRYLQSQFASRIINKWKKFVENWKKHKFSYKLLLFYFFYFFIFLFFFFFFFCFVCIRIFLFIF